jgi:hypothetical protein
VGLIARQFGSASQHCESAECAVRALQAQVQRPERSIVEASSFPDLDKLAAKQSNVLKVIVRRDR